MFGEEIVTLCGVDVYDADFTGLTIAELKRGGVTLHTVARSTLITFRFFLAEKHRKTPDAFVCTLCYLGMNADVLVSYPILTMQLLFMVGRERILDCVLHTPDDALALMDTATGSVLKLSNQEVMSVCDGCNTMRSLAVLTELRSWRRQQCLETGMNPSPVAGVRVSTLVYAGLTHAYLDAYGITMAEMVRECTELCPTAFAAMGYGYW